MTDTAMSGVDPTLMMLGLLRREVPRIGILRSYS